MATESLVEGWTQKLIFQLLKNSASFDATGMSVTLILKDKNGTLVDVTGDVDWEDILVSKVKYTPDPTDLPASGSPYTAHWKVTDAGTNVVFFPKGDADVWRVYKQ